MDVWGILFEHGFGLGNSFGLVVLYYLIRDRLNKVNVLWDWYNQQLGKQQHHIQHRRDNDE